MHNTVLQAGVLTAYIISIKCFIFINCMCKRMSVPIKLKRKKQKKKNRRKHKIKSDFIACNIALN